LSNTLEDAPSVSTLRVSSGIILTTTELCSPPELAPEIGPGTVVGAARIQSSSRITSSVVETHLNPLAREVRKWLRDDLADLVLGTLDILGGGSR